MLFLKPYNSWPKPTEFSLPDLENTLTETKTMLEKSRQQIHEYDLKYELYQKWQILKPQLIKTDKLYFELHKLDKPLKRLFYHNRIKNLKTEIEKANMRNNALEKQCLYNNFFTPDFFAEDLAWETKEKWDINQNNSEVFTYTSKTKLMDKEIGKNWIIENEFLKLEEYYRQLSEEIKRRTHSS